LWDLVKKKSGFDGDSERVILKADIEIANQDSTNSVSYSLFYGSILDLDHDFILDLYAYQSVYKEGAIFIPRIISFECTTCPEEIRLKHCLSSGKFCFTPPRAEIAMKYPYITEEILLRENVREKCIYDIISDEADEWNDHKFFNYLYMLKNTCMIRD